MTNLGRYLAETGTRQAWLAQRVGVSASTVCRWTCGETPMGEGERELVLEVLAARAALSLEGLLDDQLDPVNRWLVARPRTHVAGSPFERFLDEAEL